VAFGRHAEGQDNSLENRLALKLLSKRRRTNNQSPVLLNQWLEHRPMANPDSEAFSLLVFAIEQVGEFRGATGGEIPGGFSALPRNTDISLSLQRGLRVRFILDRPDKSKRGCSIAESENCKMNMKLKFVFLP
jgi:hypothetical protein